jgi:hypothetical protein
MSKDCEMLASAWSLPLTTTRCITGPEECSNLPALHSKHVVAWLNKQYEKVHMPNKKIMAKTTVGCAITMANCRLCITLSHKQYEWYVSCRRATCVHELGIMMSSKAAWSLHYHMQHARLKPNVTCKDQSAPAASSTFLSLHKKHYFLFISVLPHTFSKLWTL